MNQEDTKKTSEGSIVLLNSFQIDKKRFRVFYNNGLLVWEKEKSKKSE
jgi:hypothetical protein